MTEQPYQDPAEQAGQKLASYVSFAMMAGEALAQVAAARAQKTAERDGTAARADRSARDAEYGQARSDWAPLLDEQARAESTVPDAGRAWAAAQRWRPDPEAEQATALAEDRLRTLRPDVMARYDRLRADGLAPVEAMVRVAPLFDRHPAREGSPTHQPQPQLQARTGREELTAGPVPAARTGKAPGPAPAAGPGGGELSAAQRVAVSFPKPPSSVPREQTVAALTGTAAARVTQAGQIQAAARARRTS